MNDHTISLVKESFDLVEPIAPQAAAMFYANLFDADPSLERLFKADREELMQMVTLAVRQLDSPDMLTPALLGLARSQAGRGVLDEHYAVVGSAMLKTLRNSIGVAYTPEVEEAWTTAYGELADTVKGASTR